MIEFTLPVVLQFVQTLALLVGIIYYITIMRNQNKTRQIQILKDANILGDFVWRLYEAGFTDFNDFQEKYGLDTNTEFRRDFLAYFNQMEELGVYVRDGLLDVRYLALISGSTIIALWEKYESVNNAYREIHGGRWGYEWEYLYNQIKDYFSQHPELVT
jgi:hypothetical protein